MTDVTVILDITGFATALTVYAFFACRFAVACIILRTNKIYKSDYQVLIRLFMYFKNVHFTWNHILHCELSWQWNQFYILPICHFYHPHLHFNDYWFYTWSNPGTASPHVIVAIFSNPIYLIGDSRKAIGYSNGATRSNDKRANSY